MSAAGENKDAVNAAPAGQQQADGKPQGKDKKKDKKEKPQGGEEKKQGPKAPKAVPEFALHRVKLWDECQKRRDEEAKQKGPGAEISIKLKDGKVIKGQAGVTTPQDIAKSISEGLLQRAVVSKVNGKMWDLQRPLEGDCDLEICDFETSEGKHAFWHSSAHVLGLALEMEYNCKLCIGPPLDDGGFYYDCEMGDRRVSPEEFEALEQHMQQLINEKHPFMRLNLTKAEALDMFKYNPFKVEIIQSKVPDGEMCTAYRCGPLIDLCKGPHLPNTSKIKAFSITKNSSAYWLGKAENASLQRVYGISFPDKKMLKDHLAWLKLAAERDHRKLGEEQKLFFFHELSPGSCFFLPHGARVYNTLMNFMRTEYHKRGFTEVVSPNVYNADLWRTSGHWQNYRENMFVFQCEEQDFAMKPMNCPGHCLMFRHHLHSYRDLPIRFADFGVLHRNELSGALSGLTRVRRFQQDDAHIFCRQDQIMDEMRGALDFLKFVYGKFGFEFILNLSTRPENYMGEIEVWNKAEDSLRQALNETGMPWHLNPGDGAFYGPKIDIQVTDALKRKHQCATIQLDFQLPIKFELQYKNDEGKFERPVIIHRAVLGSVERMFAILLEHTGGKWPLWLSPRQVAVVPVAPTFVEYAKQVGQLFHDAGFYVEVDDSSDQFNKKVRNAQIAQFNFILVVGQEEQDKQAVNIRARDGSQVGLKSISAAVEELQKLKAEFK